MTKLYEEENKNKTQQRYRTCMEIKKKIQQERDDDENKHLDGGHACARCCNTKIKCQCTVSWGTTREYKCFV